MSNDRSDTTRDTHKHCLPQCHTAERAQPLHYSPYVTGNHVSHVTYLIHSNQMVIYGEGASTF